ncbi:hypothetical protein O6H91_07G082700 [Diphasiastrum complanatum]|uniref:Uncharacterized protein n=1 Tax=Diphasiastrum complanatum TaxID=34168 RepID=A0ACC2D757_DIPCM|nr:hypothetical protein O6H91_07G082700 [Diphasiastrum complanatum]
MSALTCVCLPACLCVCESLSTAETQHKIWAKVFLLHENIMAADRLHKLSYGRLSKRIINIVRQILLGEVALGSY